MVKIDFNDILIVPSKTTDINSRSETIPYRLDYLPLITAPMDTVISGENCHIFRKNKIVCCLPRNTQCLVGFKSYSISQIKEIVDSGNVMSDYYLIDVANGHMESIINLTKKIKELNPFVTLMVGNVANPKTYKVLSDAGADYVRIGIGNGGGCLTTQNTGVGYPMASLIKDCYDISLSLKKPAYIVADGGMQSYSDIIKALALGADYVMVGSIFNKALESSGDNYLWKKIKVNCHIAEYAYKLGIPVYKKFRGMSTKEVQKEWGVKNIKTSEGVIRYRKVEYTLAQWCENFEHYLRSAMSYTNSRTLNDFIGKVDIIKISENSYKRFNK